MPIEIPAAMLSRATDLATAASAKRLNVREDQITGDARAALSASVHKALQEQFSGAFEDSARHSVAELVRGPELQGRISDKLALGAQMVGFVSTDAQYLDILAKNAQMQKAKYDAFVTAGFTEEQAFRLLEAEVMGKAGAKAAR